MLNVSIFGSAYMCLARRATSVSVSSIIACLAGEDGCGLGGLVSVLVDGEAALLAHQLRQVEGEPVRVVEAPRQVTL